MFKNILYNHYLVRRDQIYKIEDYPYDEMRIIIWFLKNIFRIFVLWQKEFRKLMGLKKNRKHVRRNNIQ